MDMTKLRKLMASTPTLSIKQLGKKLKKVTRTPAPWKLKIAVGLDFKGRCPLNEYLDLGGTTLIEHLRIRGLPNESLEKKEHAKALYAIVVQVCVSVGVPVENILHADGKHLDTLPVKTYIALLTWFNLLTLKECTDQAKVAAAVKIVAAELGLSTGNRTELTLEHFCTAFGGSFEKYGIIIDLWPVKATFQSDTEGKRVPFAAANTMDEADVRLIMFLSSNVDIKTPQ